MFRKTFNAINYKMREIAIYGASGFGKEIACLINTINKKKPTWKLIGFFDDGMEKDSSISHFGKILGDINTLNNWDRPINVVIAIGSPLIIKYIVSKTQNSNVKFPNIIHPDFCVTDPLTFNIGVGNIINSGCISTCDVSIGNFNILNGSVTLAHDVRVGSYNVFMPTVKISGEVIIQDCNFFGVGSIALQQIKIGDNTKIGAGSVVMMKTKNGNTYIGNPARIFKY